MMVVVGRRCLRAKVWRKRAGMMVWWLGGLVEGCGSVGCVEAIL